jgi:sensor histidine kinase YesM
MIFTNKAFMRSIGITTGILLVVIMLILTYKPVFRKNLRHSYLNYIIRGIIIATTVYLLQVAYQYFTSTSSSSFLILVLNLVTYAFAVSALISTPLYFIEKLLIRPESDRIVQSAIKMLLLLIMVSLLSFLGNTSKADWSHQLFNFIALGFILAIGRGVLLFIEYTRELNVLAKETEISKLKELKAKAEIQSLQSRINPHFLYNSLNSIAGLAHSDPHKVEKMALSLSDLSERR